MGTFGKILIHKPLKIGQFPKKEIEILPTIEFQGIHIYRYVRFTGRITS